MAEIVESTPTVIMTPGPPPEPVPAAVPASEAVAKPEGESPPETEVKTDEQPEKRGESRFQRRLNKAYRRAAEFEARAKLLEERLAKLEQPRAPVDTGDPRLDQFTDIDEFAAAVKKYAAEKAVKD